MESSIRAIFVSSGGRHDGASAGCKVTLPLWRLTTFRRQVFEALGSERYSRPAVPGIHSKLSKVLGPRGVFIEAGAVDGFFESNTYYIERFAGWRGILIEPVPRMYGRLRVNRPLARAFNCALVSPELEGSTIEIIDEHATSHVGGNRSVETGGRGAAVVEVRARTLSSVLDEAGLKEIGFLSLDVEGFESEVFRGLDFRRHRPRYILVECLTEEKRLEIDNLLVGHYRFVDRFTYRDFFYEAV